MESLGFWATTVCCAFMHIPYLKLSSTHGHALVDLCLLEGYILLLLRCSRLVHFSQSLCWISSCKYRLLSLHFAACHRSIIWNFFPFFFSMLFFAILFATVSTGEGVYVLVLRMEHIPE